MSDRLPLPTPGLVWLTQDKVETQVCRQRELYTRVQNLERASIVIDNSRLSSEVERQKNYLQKLEGDMVVLDAKIRVRERASQNRMEYAADTYFHIELMVQCLSNPADAFLAFLEERDHHNKALLHHAKREGDMSEAYRGVVDLLQQAQSKVSHAEEREIGLRQRLDTQHQRPEEAYQQVYDANNSFATTHQALKKEQERCTELEIQINHAQKESDYLRETMHSKDTEEQYRQVRASNVEKNDKIRILTITNARLNAQVHSQVPQNRRRPDTSPRALVKDRGCSSGTCEKEKAELQAEAAKLKAACQQQRNRIETMQSNSQSFSLERLQQNIVLAVKNVPTIQNAGTLQKERDDLVREVERMKEKKKDLKMKLAESETKNAENEKRWINSDRQRNEESSKSIEEIKRLKMDKSQLQQRLHDATEMFQTLEQEVDNAHRANEPLIGIIERFRTKRREIFDYIKGFWNAFPGFGGNVNGQAAGEFQESMRQEEAEKAILQYAYRRRARVDASSSATPLSRHGNSDSRPPISRDMIIDDQDAPRPSTIFTLDTHFPAVRPGYHWVRGHWAKNPVYLKKKNAENVEITESNAQD
ncbi:hypothetical protein B0J14DRAFT_568637 [Halenospora varia]|nr:hypothetical protein B0J14DRAFT_568637 [Halenospora varia]